MLHTFYFKKKKEKRKENLLIAGALLFTGLAAAITTVFLTPVDGKKARTFVAQKAKKGIKQANKEIHKTSSQISTSVEKLTAAVQPDAIKSKLSDISAALKSNDTGTKNK